VQGRTVFVSSHLLAEMELLADDVIIIAAGKLIAQGKVDQIVDGVAQTGVVRVRTPQMDALTSELVRAGAVVNANGNGALEVRGVDAPAVGRAALAAQVELHELVTEKPDLEQVFLELTHGKADIR
jgi:ABC-2 type transport system ATP-binding protein